MALNFACFVANCMYITQKPQHNKMPGFFQSLEVPAQPYQHLTMDYISLLMDKNNYNCAFVIVDQLSKKVLSIPCHQTITAKEIVHLFLDYWTCNFGTHDFIISDQGFQFVSIFWNKYCRILGTKVKLTTAYNPNVDGQTEVMN